jgi:type VI secretion system protein VasJ
MKVTAKTTEWIEIGSKPVRPDAPAGDSAKYDPLYEAVQAEIQKLDGLSSQPQTVNWNDVIRKGKEILQGKSKDLLIGSYLTLALFEQERYEGLQNGLACLEEMISRYWETLFPEAKRMKGRINAFVWLGQKGGAAVGRKEPEGNEKEFFLGCVNKIESIEKLLGEKLGNDSPGLGDLRRGVEDRQKAISFEEVKQPEAKTQEEKRAEAPPPASIPSAPAVQSEVKTIDDVKPVLRQAKDLVYRSAFFLQGQDPLQPWPYRSIRAMAWLEIDNLPADEGGVTRIPAPDPTLFQVFRNLNEKEAWSDLIKQVESRFKEFPLWLDLNRYSVNAMSRLGSTYQKPAQAIKAELSKLLQRLPRLVDLQFLGAVPFADDQTRSWIEKEITAQSGAASESRGTPGPSVSGELSKEITALREKSAPLLSEGNFKEAVRIYQKGISDSPSEESRFLIRLELAKLCLESDQPKMAASQLEFLDQQVRNYSLESWNPGLSAQVFALYWQSLGRLSQENKQNVAEWTGKAEVVYRSLSRLDPVAAMDLDQKRKGWFGR